MKLRSTCATCIGMVLLSAVAIPCSADGDMFRGNALKPGEHPTGRTLTVAELDVCVGMESEIRSLKSNIDTAELVASVAETHYGGLATIIDSKRHSLDNTDQGEIDDFNKLVKEYEDAVDAYNDKATTLNDILAEHDKLVPRFNEQCTKLSYYESDLVKAYSVRERRLSAEMDREKARKAGGK